MLGARETDRLRLEPWSEAAHTPALVVANADPEVMRHIGRGATLDAEATAAQSAAFAGHWTRFGFGLWGATLRETGEVIGFIGLSHPLWLPGHEASVEVGWRLVRSAWGRGFATEGGWEAVRAGFSELSLGEIVSLIHPENVASVGVARKLGMTLSATVVNPGSGAPLHAYSLAFGGAPGRRGAVGSPGGPT
jgi:RimJ/RimL family protein N-acetyltransferase